MINVIDTEIEGVKIIEPKLFGDARGYFFESFSQREFDEKVWGADRAFFPSESLFYPYCDCEDRSILLSRLVGDLLGLKSTLIYYPGHLAMAIHFNEPVKGDYVEYNGERFVVCDPTYIGAPIGMTMPDMDNAAAKLIVVQ